MKHGLLLINLGTPNSTSFSDVRSYLRVFLTDKRVIDLPVLLRYLLVYFFILPFRTKYSANAYQTIWTKHGSPLLYHSQNLKNQVQKALGNEYQVALGMRYGMPSISAALESLKGCDRITILPLYPQYSSAATGSSIEEAMHIISSWSIIPSIHIIQNFFQHSAYIKAQATLIKNHLPEAEFVLFSYHGIPERQITKTTCSIVCQEECPVPHNEHYNCYKAQCHQTSRLIAKELQLTDIRYRTVFQSRLGKTPWIKPYTDEALIELATRGIKKIVIVCPSFVADCLETLEEIGVRAQKQWAILGGELLSVVPCLNTHPLWLEAITQIIKMDPH